ncbi:MAG TPA: cytochrome [Pseudobdellovibrionaceae bacterium]|nr:cytochrome [Pseudobdellovibrionaceae bacterium]
MFLQGDLQAIFDALYTVGAIDPVLKMDWDKITEDMVRSPEDLASAVKAVNDCSGKVDRIVEKLSAMDTRVVTFLALEVAREFVGFQDQKNLH